MVTMNAVYTGEKHCDISHGPSGSIISTDAPKDNQGKGEAFSPTDLVGAALATCILTTIGILADRDNFSIIGSTANVSKEMSAHPRKIASLPVELHLPKNLTDIQRKKCENAAHTCPVHRSLHPDVKADIHFFYDV
ncbi:MAG: OsmC family protein [Bdellovibrionales bacterium]|nr:OsmC family protein [Bdellovibrionales bacterium]